jgi:hypothetical protein
MQTQLHRLTLGVPAVLLLACHTSPAPDSRLVREWVQASQTLASTEQLAAPVASRMAAYASVALYEGYATDPTSRLRSLAGQLNGLWSVPVPPRDRALDGATVAAEAQRVVLDSLYGNGAAEPHRAIDSLARAQIAGRRLAGASAERIDRSVAHGKALGRAILSWAANDGFAETRRRRWSPPKSPSSWGIAERAPQPRSGEVTVVLAGRELTGSERGGETLGRFDPDQPTEPFWGTLRTFALRNGDECAPPAPPVYSEQRGSEYWKMGREFYDTVSRLTEEQRAIAAHWADSPIGLPQRWTSIVDQLIGSGTLTTDQAVEAYALASLAFADAFIGTWRQKYRSLGARPAPYVQRVFDARWRSQLAAAPSPEYPSESAALSGAAAEVLTNLFGDTLAFTDTAKTATGVRTRAFTNITHARDEGAFAAVYGGLHFIPSAVHGLDQGQCVGRRVVGRLKTR